MRLPPLPPPLSAADAARLLPEAERVGAGHGLEEGAKSRAPGEDQSSSGGALAALPPPVVLSERLLSAHSAALDAAVGLNGAVHGELGGKGVVAEEEVVRLPALGKAPAGRGLFDEDEEDFASAPEETGSRDSSPDHQK